MLRSLQRALGILILVLGVGGPAGALVIHPNPVLGTPDPSAAPPPQYGPGWTHVGRFGPGSAVYLGITASGEAWILTARHLGAAGSFVLGGTSYPTNGSVEFANPQAPDGKADLLAWRLVGVPPLAGLAAISSATPIAGQDVTSIGFGAIAGAFTCWDASWDTTSCLAPVHSGYPWVASAKRWGTNGVSPGSAALDAFIDELGLVDEVFATSFDSTGTVVETQGASGDSGGPAFVQNGGTWELAGLALAIIGPNIGQRPPGIAVLNEDFTFYLDLSVHRDEILAQTGVVLPEPQGGGWVAVALVALLARRRCAIPCDLRSASPRCAPDGLPSRG